MQRASTQSETQQQGTRRIFVVGIVFDDLSPCTGFANFLLADVALHRAAESMPAEFELAALQLLLDLFKRFHASSLLPRPMREVNS